LPGYKQVNPMVVLRSLSADGAHYDDLRDALEKLMLIDASLLRAGERPSRWATVSAAGSLGFCTWMIIQERAGARRFDLGSRHNRAERYLQGSDDLGEERLIDNPTEPSARNRD
jgi:GTP-binding protein LepA